MIGNWDIDARLAADGPALADWPLCQVRAKTDMGLPWLVLVPRRVGLTEWHQLRPDEGAQLHQEIAVASRLLSQSTAPTKVNVGALGNIVRQFHVHLIARYDDDRAWPGPIWGHPPAPMTHDLAALYQAITLYDWDDYG